MLNKELILSKIWLVTNGWKYINGWNNHCKVEVNFLCWRTETNPHLFCSFMTSLIINRRTRLTSTCRIDLCDTSSKRAFLFFLNVSQRLITSLIDTYMTPPPLTHTHTHTHTHSVLGRELSLHRLYVDVSSSSRWWLAVWDYQRRKQGHAGGAHLLMEEWR